MKLTRTFEQITSKLRIQFRSKLGNGCGTNFYNGILIIVRLSISCGKMSGKKPSEDGRQASGFAQILKQDGVRSIFIPSHGKQHMWIMFTSLESINTFSLPLWPVLHENCFRPENARSGTFLHGWKRGYGGFCDQLRSRGRWTTHAPKHFSLYSF